MAKNDGRAVIEKNAIVIRVPLTSLPEVIEGSWVTGNLSPRMKITDAQEFAKELVRALNDEDEEGTTPIHRMFDKGIDEAINQGAGGIEEHEEQDV